MPAISRFDGPVKAALGATLLASLLWFFCFWAFGPTLATLEERAADLAWRLQASQARETRIVLIDINEASLTQLGPWPWPRQRLAQLSDRLSELGAALQVFDVILPAAASGDAQLVASLQKNHAVLAQTFALEPNTQASSGMPSAALPWVACPGNLPQAQGYIANAAEFANLPMGHITPLLSPDGAVRHLPAVICHQDKAYPALFVTAISQALSVNPVSLEAGRGLLAPHWWLTGVSFEQPGIALDRQGYVRVPWTLQPDAFVSLSASDVLNARVPQKLLDNAWVVIGSTALGLNDRVATPFSANNAGLMVHAQLLRGALEGAIPVEPRLGHWFSALVALLGSLLLATLGRLRHKPVFTLTLIAVGLALLWWLVKALLLTRYSLWLAWLPAASYMVLFALCLSLVEYALERVQRDRLFSHLTSYLPRPVAAALANQDPSDAIDATRRSITVLYADIRNFSAYCEAHPPEETAAVLHAFFSLATRLVEQHGGLVEAFQGDAVLAVWGSGTGGPNPDQALDAALALFRASRHILPAPQPDELAPLELGIGLETGVATVGSFGLARRRTHLAIGHPVTTATRLQEMTAELAHPILVGEGMAAGVGKHRLVSMGTFLLEGLQNPSHIYAYPLQACVE